MAKEEMSLPLAVSSVADLMSNTQIETNDETDTVIIAIVSIKTYHTQALHLLNLQ